MCKHHIKLMPGFIINPMKHMQCHIIRIWSIQQAKFMTLWRRGKNKSVKSIATPCSQISIQLVKSLTRYMISPWMLDKGPCHKAKGEFKLNSPINSLDKGLEESVHFTWPINKHG